MTAVDYATETVWVVHFGHKHGDDLAVYATEELAWKAVAEIIDEWAPHEGIEGDEHDRIEALLGEGTVEAITEARAMYLEHAQDETIDVASSPLYRK